QSRRYFFCNRTSSRVQADCIPELPKAWPRPANPSFPHAAAAKNLRTTPSNRREAANEPDRRSTARIGADTNRSQTEPPPPWLQPAAEKPRAAVLSAAGRASRRAPSRARASASKARCTAQFAHRSGKLVKRKRLRAVAEGLL